MKQSGELFTEGFKGKSQAISQKQVLAAYKQVKTKGGAGGVDGLNFKEFETKRNDHLYKLWNRLASGSYFPQAVRQKRITETVRKLKIHRATGFELTEIAELLAPKLRGWITYYGKHSFWTLQGVMQQVNERLVRWVMGKYKRFRRRKQEAREYLRGIAQDFPNLFVHWKYGFTP